MTDLSPQAQKAALKTVTKGWGSYANAEHHAMYVEPLKSRKKCLCGCGNRQTHITMANGIGLKWGCELSCHRFAKQMNKLRELKS